jgi:sodium-dependent dicarboxylate transporter 2/3/5
MSERLAYRVLGLGALKSDPLRAFVGLGLTTAFISAWISNTATTAMMLPIASRCCRHAARRERPPRRFGT